MLFVSSVVARFTLIRSCALQVRISVTSIWPTLRTRALAIFQALDE
jgi:hypothetical protein